MIPFTFEKKCCQFICFWTLLLIWLSVLYTGFLSRGNYTFVRKVNVYFLTIFQHIHGEILFIYNNKPHFFILLIDLGDDPNKCWFLFFYCLFWGLHLAALGGLYRSARDQTQVNFMHGRYPTHCTVSPVPGGGRNSSLFTLQCELKWSVIGCFILVIWKDKYICTKRQKKSLRHLKILESPMSNDLYCIINVISSLFFSSIPHLFYIFLSGGLYSLALNVLTGFFIYFILKIYTLFISALKSSWFWFQSLLLKYQCCTLSGETDFARPLSNICI